MAQGANRRHGGTYKPPKYNGIKYAYRRYQGAGIRKQLIGRKKKTETTMNYRDRTQEEMDSDFSKSVIKDMREKETEWIKRGYCFSWIDPEPTWMTVSDWSMLFTNDNKYDQAFPDPEKPCVRIMRFSLLGGGQIRTIE